MPWLRLDDGWNTHPKILVLTTSERARWLDVLTTCARHRTGGHVDRGVLTRCGIRPATLSKITTTLPGERGPLLHDLGGGAYQVHNWALYNSDDAYERVRILLENDFKMSANEVVKRAGGKREILLKAYAHYQENPHELRTHPVPENHPGTTPQPVPRNHPSGSPRAQAPSRPVPSSTTASNEAAALAAAAAEPHTHDDPDDLVAAGWTASQLERLDDPAERARAHGLLAEARADTSVRRPGALAWQRFSQGAQPGTTAAAASVASGAQGSRSQVRLLPFGPCAVDGCDVRASSVEALEEHRRNVHGEGDGERVGPPAELLRLLGTPPPAAGSGSGEPDVDIDDEAPDRARGGEAA